MGDLNDNDGGVENLTDDDASGTEDLMAGNADGAEIWTLDDRTVNYVFPVEVVVIGALTEEDHRVIEQRIWANFGEAWAQQSA